MATGLHSKLLSWNEGIGNKFVSELVYLAFNIIPVYGICYLADALVGAGILRRK